MQTTMPSTTKESGVGRLGWVGIDGLHGLIGYKACREIVMAWWAADIFLVSK